MTENDIKRKIETAAQKVYDKDKCLINHECNELTINALVACALRNELPNWNVDVEFNRDGDKSKKVGNTVVKPDIIIHRRGKGMSNLAVIEAKGYWNSESRQVDEEKARKIKESHNYKYAFRLEYGQEKPEVFML